MKALKHLPQLLLLLLAIALFAMPAVAGDRETKEVTIIDEDGVTYVCRYDDDNLRVFNKETGEEVLEMDFDDIEKAIDKAMSQVEVALENVFEELSDIELDLHFGGDDNQFHLDLGDEDITIDFDDLIASLGEVFADLENLECFHDGEIIINGHALHGSDGDDYSDLKEEISALKKELKQLKRELKKSDIDY